MVKRSPLVGQELLQLVRHRQLSPPITESEAEDASHGAFPWRIAPGATEEIQSELTELLFDADPNVRIMARQVLCEDGREDRVVDHLFDQAMGGERLLQFDAISLLPVYAKIDERTETAVSYCYRHGDKNLRKVSAEAYLSLLPRRYDPTLGVLALLDSADWEVRLAVTQALGKSKPGSMAVASILIALLRDPNDSVRFSATQSLGKFSSHFDIIRPAIAEALEKEQQLHVKWEMEKVISDIV